MASKDENEEQRGFCTLNRNNPFNQENSQKWESPLQKNRVLVFDGKSNIPTYADEYSDAGLIGEIYEKWHVDKDDLAFNVLCPRKLPFSNGTRCPNRIITASDALKNLVTVDQEQGSFKIKKIDFVRDGAEKICESGQRARLV